MNSGWIQGSLLSGVAVFLGFALVRYRNYPEGRFSPLASWVRAYLYFVACFLFAWVTGALDALLDSAPLPVRLDAIWWTSTLGLMALIVVAYWGLWARWTLRFDRKLDVLPQIIFGLSWGLSYGLCFLGFWHLAMTIGDGWPVWGIFLLAYVLISVWQMVWQDLYWDLYIAPEHDTPWTTKYKVPFAHIPNVTFSLWYFAAYDAYWFFVFSQVLALTGCSIAMRMPAPWSRESTPLASRHPLAFGLVHGGGYVSADPENDPHLKAIGVPY